MLQLAHTWAPDQEAHFSFTRLPVASKMYLSLVFSGSGGMIVFDATVLVLVLVLLLVLLFLLLLLVLLTLLPSHCSNSAQ
jgi:hypothetical protein